MSNTLFTGKVYHRFDELTSTNDRAAELIAKSKPPEGTALRADTQTAGRGQFGSQWLSPPGLNLLTSIIYYPDWLPAMQQFYLSMAVALGVKDTLTSVVAAGEDGPRPAVAIKWPNDLYLNDKKTGGILIQNSLSGQHIESSIIGIGLNVNQLEFDPTLPNPTSVALAAGRLIDIDALVSRLFECLEIRYLQLKYSRNRSEIKSDYEAALFRRNLPSKFMLTSNQTSFSGVITGVAENGRLQMLQGDTELSFDLKEISFQT